MKYAYVTMLSTENYFDGILALYKGLKLVKSKYPLVVCVTPNISSITINKLKKLNIEVLPIPQLTYTDKLVNTYKQRGKDYLSNIASKFYLFGLSQFDKIVSLDCDLLILQNIDNLFDYPHGSAVPISNGRWISGGVVVLEPSEKFRDELIALSIEYNCNEEHSLNHYFKNWPVQSELHLPAKYNVDALFSMFILRPAIIHFIGKNKPFLIKNNTDIIKNSKKYYFDLYLKYIQQVKDEYNL